MSRAGATQTEPPAATPHPLLPLEVWWSISSDFFCSNSSHPNSWAFVERSRGEDFFGWGRFVAGWQETPQKAATTWDNLKIPHKMARNKICHKRPYTVVWFSHIIDCLGDYQRLCKQRPKLIKLQKMYSMLSCLMNVYNNYGQKWPPEGAQST